MERLDGAGRARRARAGRLPRPTPTPRRAGSPPTPAIASTPTPCWRRACARRRRRAAGLDETQVRREVDEAMRETTAELLPDHRPARPGHRAAAEHRRIHRVEVLLLQPRVVMVVVIASNGAVTKRIFTFSEPLDPGLVGWASSYLNERLSGLGLGARMIADRLADAGARRRRGRVPRRDRRHVLGARGAPRGGPLPGGRRAPALRGPCRRPAPGGRADAGARAPGGVAAGSALGPRRALGVRLDRRREPHARAPLGERGRRQLRARLPEPRARLACSGRCAWTTRRRSSRFATRPVACRASSRRSTKAEQPVKRDYYEVLGVDRGARRRGGEEGVPAAGARAAPGRQQARPRGRGEVQGGRRGLRGPLRPRAPRHLRPVRPRGPELPGLGASGRRVPKLRGRAVGLLRPRRSAVRRAVRLRPAPDRRAAAMSPPRSSSSLEDVLSGASREVSFEAVSTCERCRGNGAEPGTPIRACETCGGSGELREVARTAFGQLVRTGLCPTCGGQGRVPEQPCEECGGEGRTVRARTWEVEVPPGIESGQRIRIAGAGHAGEAADRRRGPLRGGAGRRRRALRAPRPGPGGGGRDPRDPRDARRQGHRPDARRRARGRGPRGRPARGARGAAGIGPAVAPWPGPRRPARGARRLRALQPERGRARGWSSGSTSRSARRAAGARTVDRAGAAA